MAQANDRCSARSDSDTLEEDAAISRKAFLVETLGITAGVSALLAEIGAPAQGKEGETVPIGRHIESEFNEEAQVAAKYAAFAVQAKSEGFPQTAKLFQALVAAEMLHAEWLLRLMNGVKRTADNLQAGADYEAYLAGKVLPVAAAQAGRENNSKAETLFRHLLGAGGRHEQILRRVREQILAGRDMDPQPLWVCPKCGTILAGAAPDKCPVCAAPAAKFIPVA